MRQSNTYQKEREQIVHACQQLQQMGFFLGTWGNVSMRIGDDILLTPSRVEYGSMVPEDIVVITPEGKKVQGTRVPTSEKEVHRQIYLHRQDVKAVVHTHTTCAMAASALEVECIPCMVEEMAQLLGGALPLTARYVPAGQHAALGESAALALGNKNAVLLRNHGCVGCGKDLQEAILAAQVAERAAKMYLLVCASGKRLQEIEPEAVQKERNRYLYAYGKEET